MTKYSRPGRPRLDPHDSSVPVNLTLPATQYDNLYQLARREQVSVPEVIRRLIRRDRDDDGEDE